MMKRRSVTVGAIVLIGLALAAIFLRPSDEGVTPLMIAAKEGDSISVELSISEGYDLDEQSAYGWTAMMFASWQGHDNVVRLLVEAGADPNIVSGKIPAGFLATSGGYPETSAIFEAISNKHFAIAEYLLEQNVTVPQSALAVAGARGTPELLERLVDKGAQINAISTNQFHRAALSEAAQAGQIRNMVWLIDNGADPNLSLPHSTPLNEAIRGLQPQAVALLIEAGAEVNALIGSRKETALRNAIYTYTRGKHDQQIQIITTLLEAGANPNYRPDEHVRTLIEQVEFNIEAGIAGSQNPENDASVRERYRRSLAADRLILGLLMAHQSNG
jgi:ankyrin repeat protein